MEQNQTTLQIDERDEAFQNLIDIIKEAPLETEHKIKMIDALQIYIQTIFKPKEDGNRNDNQN